MPTYEYRCANGHRFELFQKITDEPARSCPACGADAERILSAGAGLLFKGSGFYITDYRSADYKERAKAETGTGGKTGEGGEGGKDAKASPDKAKGGDASSPSGSSPSGSSSSDSSSSGSSSDD